MKAIETQYKNYRFRSRNEARWAIYFDALGVKWEYEPEGFTLSDGSNYLPDFWFPDYKAYGEVKPSNFESDSKHSTFVLDSKSQLILFIGPPSDTENVLIWYEDVPDIIVPAGKLACKNVGRAFTKEIMGKDFGVMYFGDVKCRDFAIMDYAVTCAKKARFEHGETPVVLPYSGFYKHNKLVIK